MYIIFIAAVSHVKWNGISRHLLATTHNGDVKIWDERKASSPIQYISAHLTSVSDHDFQVCLQLMTIYSKYVLYYRSILLTGILLEKINCSLAVKMEQSNSLI